jgi:hypothetical protein
MRVQGGDECNEEYNGGMCGRKEHSEGSECIPGVRGMSVLNRVQ